MRNLKSGRLIPGLAVLAVLAVPLLAPPSAQASKALFRVHRTFYSHQTVTNSLEPPSMNGTMGQKAEAPGTAYVFNQANQFVLPKAFISYMLKQYCGEPMAGMCFPGYPVSGGYYSYTNGVGRFGQPTAGAPGPTMTTTVVFPTTGGNNLPFGGAPNSAMGVAVNATMYGGPSSNYNFSRGGSIHITPGANKFSGTMRFINGPNAVFHQFIDFFSPNFYQATGVFLNPTAYDPTNPGETTSSGAVTRFLLTGPSSTKAGGAKASDGMGGYVSSVARYIHENAPWTTGRARVYNVIGYYQTRITKTGYDNKAPGKVGGLTPTRVVSLVRPRLKHAYLAQEDGSIITNFQAARIWRMDVLFLPEPAQIVLLATGIAGLAGLAGLARRRRR